MLPVSMLLQKITFYLIVIGQLERVVNNQAELYNMQGLKLLHAKKLNEAIEFFTKAIEIEPTFPDAYHNRGEIQLMLGNIVEGNTDIYKAKELKSGKLDKKSKRKVAKYNWQDVESIYDNVFSSDTIDDSPDGETVAFDSDIYDYVFSDDNIESDKLWNGLIDGPSGTPGCPAILEFLGGEREEVACVVLFRPSPDEITVVQLDDEKMDRVIPLNSLGSVRLAMLPSCFKQVNKANCQIEIIETRDGNIYHEFIDPDHVCDNGLIGVSTKEDTHLPYTYFPSCNIKSRCQQRYLGDILLDKRFISGDALKGALEEHQMLKGMQLGKIIARQDNILYSVIETTLEDARAQGKNDLRVGEILLDAGLVNEEQIQDALAFQKSMQTKKLGEFLIEKGILREKELYISLAEKYMIPFIDLRQQKVSKKSLSLLPREVVLKYKVMPLGKNEEVVVVATPYPDSAGLQDTVAAHLQDQKVQFVLAQPTHLKNVINILYEDRRTNKDNA